ncbi:MAG: hypothetical protein E6K72_07040 [Candidatus Eisenbacteria bacterium]|uniref:Tetratricopeptide repeat protein n=1 Tax=Eiseniibacteriota bacterium TaxID=2212470 RepID=A0A538SUG1_UNCEI|nr:MAG: hypothetical protein E6K72_07040 [Candidatus Eisenbacteria bacterium]
MRSRARLAAALLALAATGFIAQIARATSGQTPLAYIAAISGRVDVARSSKTGERGTIGLALLKGDRVQVGAGSGATLFFNDGNLLELSEKSTITVGTQNKGARRPEPNPAMAGVFKSVSEGVVGGSRETGLVALAPVRGGPSGAEVILAPRQTQILDDRPMFRWRAVAGANRYRVVVSGEAGELWQRETGDTSLAYPADAAPLPRGGDVLWALHASNDRGSLAEEENSFQIKPVAECDAIRHQLEQIEKNAGGAAPFVAGAYLSGQGLLLDAIVRLEALCRDHPTQPGPHEALGRLYRAVGLMDLAAAELQDALTLGRQP